VVPEEEEEKSASEKLTDLVLELGFYKGAMAGSATGVPAPPALGQNPALRMQNQQQATAQSITPAPTANPAVMQAEQKAMQAEQAAAAQQSQVEQSAQQAQMEMEQRFQQELAKAQQEKEVLQLNLEKEKAMGALQKEQAKAHAALSKAQSSSASGAASNDEGVAQRMLSNRLSRLAKRLGSAKSASVGPVVNGRGYSVTQPAVPPPAATPPQIAPLAPGQLDVNGTRYVSGPVPGMIEGATGNTIMPPLTRLKPEAGDKLNAHPGARQYVHQPGIYRASYGTIGDTIFDQLFKSKLATPKSRLISQSDVALNPDSLGLMRQVFENQVHTDPRIA
jgi:hypothetical protein